MYEIFLYISMIHCVSIPWYFTLVWEEMLLPHGQVKINLFLTRKNHLQIAHLSLVLSLSGLNVSDINISRFHIYHCPTYFSPSLCESQDFKAVATLNFMARNFHQICLYEFSLWQYFYRNSGVVSILQHCNVDLSHWLSKRNEPQSFSKGNEIYLISFLSL